MFLDCKSLATMTRDLVRACSWDTTYRPSVRIIAAFVLLRKELCSFSDQAVIWQLWFEWCFQAVE
jgi:hypothetical protein